MSKTTRSGQADEPGFADDAFMVPAKITPNDCLPSRFSSRHLWEAIDPPYGDDYGDWVCCCYCGLRHQLQLGEFLHGTQVMRRETCA